MADPNMLTIQERLQYDDAVRLVQAAGPFQVQVSVLHVGTRPPTISFSVTCEHPEPDLNAKMAAIEHVLNTLVD